MLGGGSLVLSDPAESTADFLARAAASRRHPYLRNSIPLAARSNESGAHQFNPQYVRLSGEIADQAILDHLRAFYPHANSPMPLLPPKPGWPLMFAMAWPASPHNLSDQPAMWN